ncbi:MAG TPA: hypothetical protein VMJ14_08260 [Burkholderiales bacterium]|nr:hypothetical protein [Burkholderiales bacterium]
MKLKNLCIFLLLAGCSSSTPPEPRTYDLGLSAPSTRLPAARIGAVRAVAPFDAADMQYRLAYRNAAEIAPFANSRWAAAPADMLRKQLLRASGDGNGRCTIAVEIQEFTQVFTAEAESEARVEMRVSAYVGASARSRQLSVIEAKAGPDAISGAAAFSRAVDRAIGEIGAWVGAQPDCR